MPPIIRTLLVCEDTVLMPTDKAPKILLVSPALNFLVPFLPTQVSFSMYAAISHYKPHTETKCQLQILDPNGETLNIQDWIVTDDVNRPENIQPSSIFSSNVKNLIVRNSGSYRLIALHDGVKIGEYVFDILLEN